MRGSVSNGFSTFLTLSFVILVVDRPVLEPPVLDAVNGVDARPVVLDS